MRATPLEIRWPRISLRGKEGSGLRRLLWAGLAVCAVDFGLFVAATSAGWSISSAQMAGFAGGALLDFILRRRAVGPGFAQAALIGAVSFFLRGGVLALLTQYRAPKDDKLSAGDADVFFMLIRLGMA